MPEGGSHVAAHVGPHLEGDTKEGAVGVGVGVGGRTGKGQMGGEEKKFERMEKLGMIGIHSSTSAFIVVLFDSREWKLCGMVRYNANS